MTNETKKSGSGELIQTFQDRARRLQTAGFYYLVFACLLLFSGIPAVVYAPNITAGDINTRPSLSDRLAASRKLEQAAQNEFEDAGKSLDAVQSECNQRLREFFKDVNATDSPIGSVSERVITIAVPIDQSDLKKEVASFFAKQGGNPPAVMGILVKPCNQALITVRRDQYQNLTDLLSNGKLQFDPKTFREIQARRGTLGDTIAVQREAQKKMYEQEAREAAGAISGASEAGGKDDLLARLVQTSVTRFGLLAVIGFFVSILVSLYRYNIRLAAFYLARSDARCGYRLAPYIRISSHCLRHWLPILSLENRRCRQSCNLSICSRHLRKPSKSRVQLLALQEHSAVKGYSAARLLRPRAVF